MKTTMKKAVAYLLAMLLVFQILPAMAEVSNTQPAITSYREKLDIKAVTKTLPVGMTTQLETTDKYDNLIWSSSDPLIAEVDQKGLVTGKSEGKVKITATEGEYSDSVTLRVIGNGEETEENTTISGNEGAPAEKMIIIINGTKTKVTYDGEVYTTGYTAACQSAGFDESLLEMVNPDHYASSKDCGIYQDALAAEDFIYHGEGEYEIVLTNGWLQIKPVTATIMIDDQKMAEGGTEPEYTATVSGILEGEDPAQIVYTLKKETKNGTNRIVAEYEEIQGNYRVTSVDGELTVMKEWDLYNLVKINNTYYRLKKTKIWTVKDPTKDKNGTLSSDDYIVNGYDFTDLVVTINGTDYVYNCSKNAEAIIRGANYYEVKPNAAVSIVKNKIGALDGNKVPRWIIPEEDRYPDKNETDSIHRDYEIILKENKTAPTDQRAYNMLSVNGSANYYKLPTTNITAKSLDQFALGKINAGEYILERYDFTHLVLEIDGVEYKYNDGSLDEYENYYTVVFDDVQKNDRFNRNDNWFKDRTSWLDGAYEEYGTMVNKTTTFHANYNATTHKAEQRKRSVKISSSWPAGKVAYPGAKIKLTATLDGFTDKVHLQWQRSIDRINWEDVPGANGMTFTYTLDDSTAQYSWRVVADE